MKRLILKKLVIISSKNEEARIIEFDDDLTIITGDNPNGKTINRTGKSLVMKAIYYSLGAKIKKYAAYGKFIGIARERKIPFSYLHGVNMGQIVRQIYDRRQ